MIDWDFKNRDFEIESSGEKKAATPRESLDRHDKIAQANETTLSKQEAPAKTESKTDDKNADSEKAAPESSKPKKKSRFLLVVAIICFCVAGTCAIYIGTVIYGYYAANSRYEQIQAELDSMTSTSTNKKIVKLQKQNSNCVAWLKASGTRINYPVMYTPKHPQYYLHRDFDKKTSIAGSLFIGKAASLKGNSTIIYGHHMADQSMFGTLENFNSVSFAKKHKFTLITVNEKRTYKVVYAFYEDLTKSSYFHYWDFVGTLKKKRFNKLLKTVKKKSIYSTGVKISFDSNDKIAMFSTCSYGTSEQRFCVVCKLVKSQ